jgi:iron complex outermembrane receptor protein
MSGLPVQRAFVRISIVAAVIGTNGAFAQAAPATANTASTSGDPLQEVVVTAQFRNESVQQTPLAITAVNAAMLEERNQTSLNQVTADAPSVTLLQSSTAFGPSMTAFIRGIGQSDLDPALEPGVGIYVDDVYFGTLTGSLLDLLDLDRVEVLRGPQGTLEGMNSIGGAVKLFSQKPTGSGATTVSLLYGSRNHVEARASTDFTLVPDHLFVRIAGVENHQDGYVNVFDFGCANPSFTATDVNGVTGTYSVAPQFNTHAGSCQTGQEGGIGYGGGRISVRWVVNDQLEATFTGDITQENQENPATTLLYAKLDTITLPTTSGALLPYDSAKVPAMIPHNPYASYANFSIPAVTTCSPLAGILGAYCPSPPYQGSDSVHLLSWGGAATIDYKINDTMSLRSISSERAFTSSWYEDNDASPWPVGLGGENLEHHQFSEELRFNGSWNHLLDYTVGAFYFRELSVYGTHQDLWYAAGPGILNFLGQDPILAHDRAGFIHAQWHLTDKLDFITGVRYTTQNKDYTYVRTAPDGSTAALVGALNGVTGTYKGNKTDYRADIDYHWTDDLMTYGQVSTGFKGGGVNPRPFYQFQAVHFNPETVTTYEVGVKSSWFDRRLRANVDGYFAQYKDIQLALLNCDFLNPPGTPPGQPCALPFNAGNAHMKGLELELQARPINGLDIDISGSYLKFNYTGLSSNPTGVTLGMTTPYTPKLQGNIGIQYRIPFGNWGSLTPRLDANARSEIYTNSVNASTNRVGGYTLYNARLTWRPEKNDSWEASLEALNLTSKLYYITVFDLTQVGGGSLAGTPGPPREIALEIKHTL